MNLERMKQAAIEKSEDGHKWAVICTDGDMKFYDEDTDDVIRHALGWIDGRERLTGDHKLDYGLVRVDV